MYPSLKAENDQLKAHIQSLLKIIEAGVAPPQVIPEHACEMGINLRDEWSKAYELGGEAEASTAEGAYVLKVIAEQTREISRERDEYKHQFTTLLRVVQAHLRSLRSRNSPSKDLYSEVAADLHDDVAHALGGVALR